MRGEGNGRSVLVDLTYTIFLGIQKNGWNVTVKHAVIELQMLFL